MCSDWDSLSDKYEDLQIREDSLDHLVEYPSQLELIGDIQGKRILDVACGSGRKAMDWVNSGAEAVCGFDLSQSFVKFWESNDKPENLAIFEGDLSNIAAIENIKGLKFDIVTCFQAISYSKNLNKTLSDIHDLLTENGIFVFTIAHPFRYVIEKMEKNNVSPADAYRDIKKYTYPAIWDPSISITHSTLMISDILNHLVQNHFQIETVIEPDLTDEQKINHPHKNDWMRKYFGIIGFRCKAI